MCVGPLKKKPKPADQQTQMVTPPPPPPPAATGVFGERIEGGPISPASSGFMGLFSNMLRLAGRPGLDVGEKVAPGNVGAGRIGHAYGASDLRINIGG